MRNRGRSNALGGLTPKRQGPPPRYCTIRDTMTLTTRQRLRAEVWEMSGGQCEHPGDTHRCPIPATELAHIFPRGMGHNGYRDTLGNVMAACPVHARSTDDLSSPEWVHVGAGTSFDRRTLLTDYVNTHRRAEGWMT